MAVLEELGSVLQTAGVGTVGTTIFYAGLPPTPDECVAIAEYPNAGPVVTLSGVGAENYRAQIMARSTSVSSARSLATSAYTALRDFRSGVVSGARLIAVLPTQVPFPMGDDENLRSQYGFNVDIMRQPL